VHLEARVFGRRADQRDGARLDVGEEGILLRLVEAVDLVAEEDGARTAGVPPRLGLTQDLADARHAFRDRAERDEDGARALGDDAGERRLPRPGRAPEDEAADL